MMVLVCVSTFAVCELGRTGQGCWHWNHSEVMAAWSHIILWTLPLWQGCHSHRCFSFSSLLQIGTLPELCNLLVFLLLLFAYLFILCWSLLVVSHWLTFSPFTVLRKTKKCPICSFLRVGKGQGFCVRTRARVSWMDRMGAPGMELMTRLAHLCSHLGQLCLPHPPLPWKQFPLHISGFTMGKTLNLSSSSHRADVHSWTEAKDQSIWR